MMKNKYPALLLILCFLALNACGLNIISTDTVVAATGKVKENENMGPLKAVVEYKRLPYGNEGGRISSNEDGEFTFYVRGDGSYSLFVTSEGYFGHSEEFNVSLELSNTGSIDREIVLEAGAAGYVFTLENLIFEQGQSAITTSSHGELDMVVSRLNEFPLMEIQLEGHTDYIGNADQNMNLSRDRVNAVKNYIVGKGIQPERIQTRAYGGTQPLVRDDDPNARAVNRRVEVRILKVE
jgi:outer membrane protein OmpA-like peptidoglycan-associated protein